MRSSVTTLESAGAGGLLGGKRAGRSKQASAHGAERRLTV